MSNLKRSKALPFLGRGPSRREQSDASMEEHGFMAVIMIFARTWPFIRPYILGYWREISWQPSTLVSSHDHPGATSDSGWSFKHIPPLVTITALMGPMSGVLPLNTSWLFDFLLMTTCCMTLLSWSLLYVKQKLYVGVSSALFIIGTIAFLFAVFVVEGVLDNIFIALICGVTSGIWLIQYRLDQGKLHLRIRLGSHLIYYFIGVWASTLLLLLISLFSVDVVSQSILQAKPLTPFIAGLIEESQLASSNAAVQGNANVELVLLSAEQRHSLKSVYAVFLVIG